MSAGLPQLRAPSVHRVPRARLEDRIDLVRSLVRGRRVIDLGFVDEGEMTAKCGRGTWLHEVVRSEARQCLGIDADEVGVTEARRLGFDAHLADLQDTDAVASLGLDPAEVMLAASCSSTSTVPATSSMR